MMYCLYRRHELNLQRWQQFGVMRARGNLWVSRRTAQMPQQGSTGAVRRQRHHMWSHHRPHEEAGARVHHTDRSSTLCRPRQSARGRTGRDTGQAVRLAAGGARAAPQAAIGPSRSPGQTGGLATGDAQATLGAAVIPDHFLPGRPLAASRRHLPTAAAVMIGLIHGHPAACRGRLAVRAP